jgi:putative FmdB family regulatory protein
MPTYDYSCEGCGAKLEISQKITDAPLSTCPECHGETLKRGIGGGHATFRFMGDGFYITDYKKECSNKSSCCCPCDKSN